MDHPRHLGWKALATLADQSLTSAGVFFLNVLLARWMEPREYGAFVTGFAVFLLLGRFHQALLLEPMSVFARSEYLDRQAAYRRTVLGLHWWIAGGLAGLPVLAGAACGSAGLRWGWSLAAMGLALPWLLLQWTLRRMTYVAAGPVPALGGAAVYGTALAAGAVGLRETGRLSAESAWLLLGLSALLSSLAMWSGAGLSRPDPPGAAAGWREAVALHWRYGKWAGGFSVLDAISEALYLPLIGTVLGLREAALFRAMENLLQPIQLAMSSVTLLGLPMMAERVKAEGREFLARAGQWAPAGMAALAGGYALLLVAAAPWLTRFLYQRADYSEALEILPLLAGALVLRSLGDGAWGVLLRAAARPDAVFWGAAGGAAVSLLIGLPAVWGWGLRGAALGRLASATLFTVVVAAGFVEALGRTRGRAIQDAG